MSEEKSTLTVEKNTEMSQIMNPEKLILTVEEAAQILQISLKSAYKNLITLPGFPVKKIGKRLIIPKAAFMRWLEENNGIES